MSIMLNKTEFLQALDAVRPGLVTRSEILQSNCLVFRNGKVFTFNGNISCRIKSGLPNDLVAVVPAHELISTLHKISAETIVVKKGKRNDENILSFIQKDESVWVRMDEEVTLPIDQIEQPKEWQKLSPDFSEAIGVVQDCTASDPQKDLGQIHITPNYVEACDGFQLAKYKLKTGFDKSFMIRGDAMKFISPLGMTKVSLTETWIHFKNPSGLVVTVRRTVADSEYPDISKFFIMENAKSTVLPNGLGEAVDIATTWAQQILDDGPGGMVLLELKKGACRVYGIGLTGGYKKKLKIDYTGKTLRFKISTKILSMICKKFNEVQINEEKLSVTTSRWQYVTSLTPPETTSDTEPSPPTDEE